MTKGGKAKRKGYTLGEVLFGGSSSGSSGGQKKQPRKAKGQDSRKVHDTKGKNTHGRRSW